MESCTRLEVVILMQNAQLMRSAVTRAATSTTPTVIRVATITPSPAPTPPTPAVALCSVDPGAPAVLEDAGMWQPTFFTLVIQEVSAQKWPPRFYGTCLTVCKGVTKYSHCKFSLGDTFNWLSLGWTLITFLCLIPLICFLSSESGSIWMDIRRMLWRVGLDMPRRLVTLCFNAGTCLRERGIRSARRVLSRRRVRGMCANKLIVPVRMEDFQPNYSTPNTESFICLQKLDWPQFLLLWHFRCSGVIRFDL